MIRNRVLNCTIEQYHADPCETPSLSHSVAHELINKSPLHSWMRHPRLGGQHKKETKEMDRGSLVHALLLGAGKPIVIIKADDWRTKASQQDRDYAREQGHIPVLEKT